MVVGTFVTLRKCDLCVCASSPILLTSLSATEILQLKNGYAASVVKVWEVVVFLMLKGLLGYSWRICVCVGASIPARPLNSRGSQSGFLKSRELHRTAPVVFKMPLSMRLSPQSLSSVVVFIRSWNEFHVSSTENLTAPRLCASRFRCKMVGTLGETAIYSPITVHPSLQHTSHCANSRAYVLSKVIVAYSIYNSLAWATTVHSLLGNGSYLVALVGGAAWLRS